MVSSTNVVRIFFPLAKHNEFMLEIPSTFVFRKINLSTICMSRSDYLFTPAWMLFSVVHFIF